MPWSLHGVYRCVEKASFQRGSPDVCCIVEGRDKGGECGDVVWYNVNWFVNRTEKQNKNICQNSTF